VRSLASDVLGAALLSFSDQRSIASDVLKNALPRLDNKNKFKKWVFSLRDPKLQDDLAILEERALLDAESELIHLSRRPSNNILISLLLIPNLHDRFNPVPFY
jgi:hypothetical protein